MSDSASGSREMRESERVFGEALGRVGPALLAGLAGVDGALRRLHPPDFPILQRELIPLRERLRESRAVFEAAKAPDSAETFKHDLLAVSTRVLSALDDLVEPGADGFRGVFRAMHRHAQAQAALYPLRKALPPVSAYFAETFRHGDLSALEAEPGSAERVGLFRSGEPGARGGFDLYVPESYDGQTDCPLVVALHGGSGSGENFLWSWLREARSRGFLLLAPTSRGTTWSLSAPEIDGRGLREITEWVGNEWRVDREQILLTGLSDGATMSLLVGLGEPSPFTHLAPVSGVLHPINFAQGNLDRAGAKPIYLVHGALDWMFPVALAREAAKVLDDAGAALVFREIEDLSHTYPREENGAILDWFSPATAAPA